MNIKGILMQMIPIVIGVIVAQIVIKKVPAIGNFVNSFEGDLIG